MKAVKIIALVLTACLALTFTSSAAYKPSGEEKVRLTVTNASQGDVFRAYRIIDIIWNKENNTLERQWAESFIPFFSTVNPDGSRAEPPLKSGYITPQEFSALADTDPPKFRNILTRINVWLNVSAQSAILPDYTSAPAQAAEGGVQADLGEVSLGGYLVTAAESEDIYSPMFLPIEPEIRDGKYVLDNESTFDISAKHTSVRISRRISGDSFSAGDRISFTTEFLKPLYTDDFLQEQLFMITDSLAQGTSLVQSSLKVYGVSGESETLLTADENYVVHTQTENYFNICFLRSHYDTLDKYEKIIVRYDAVLLTEGAQLGAENRDTATLLYACDTGQGYAAQNADAVFHTYAITVRKTDGSEMPLAGAEFRLYRPATADDIAKGKSVSIPADADGGLIDAVAVENAGAEYSEDSPAAGNESSVTDREGRAEFAYLAEGVYYLYESRAPAGFVLPQTAVRVEVSADSAGENGCVDVKISNFESFLLPSTGGRGTAVMYFFAVVLIIAAGLLFNAAKK